MKRKVLHNMIYLIDFDCWIYKTCILQYFHLYMNICRRNYTNSSLDTLSRTGFDRSALGFNSIIKFDGPTEWTKTNIALRSRLGNDFNQKRLDGADSTRSAWFLQLVCSLSDDSLFWWKEAIDDVSRMERRTFHFIRMIIAIWSGRIILSVINVIM